VSTRPLEFFGRIFVLIGLSASMVGCAPSVVLDGSEGDGGSGASADPLVGTSEDHPPTGLWTMAVQYGAVGEEVSPTIPLQVELRADGTAYRWMCAEAPSDGSFDEPCDTAARRACMVGSVAWDGAQWRFEFPALEEQFIVDEMGPIIPDGQGRLLLSYINPTYSGALFRRVAAAATDGASCEP